MDYQEAARELGYTGDAEKLESIGKAIEIGHIAWGWYEAGDDQYDVAALFRFRDEAPTEQATIEAYAEGAANSEGAS